MPSATPPASSVPTGEIPQVDPVLLEADEAPQAASTLTGRQTALLIGVLAVSALIMILNETMLSVALPDLMADFGIGAATAQWLTTGFLLTMAVVIPATGFLIQRFTTRALFTLALTTFLAGTALAGLAPTFPLMLAARVVQATGTAVILPLLMTTTLTTVPIRLRGTVMGLNGVVISVAPALGPTVAGIVVDLLGWRWMFWILLPVIAIALAIGLRLIRPSGATRRVPLDVLSVVLSAVGFGGLVHGLSSLGSVLDGARLPVLTFTIGVLGLAAFIIRQVRLQRTGSALLDLRPFAQRTFRLSVVVLGIAMATMLGTVMVLPLHLQEGLGVSVLTTGLVVLPGGLVQGLVSPFIGRLYDRIGPRPIVVPGAVLLAGGQWGLSTLATGTGLGTVVALHTMFAVGMAMLMTPLMTVALSVVPPDLYGHGSAIVSTLQQLAGAAGTALLIAAMTIGVAGAAAGGAAGAAAQVAGTHGAFVVGGCLALVAVVIAPFIARPQLTEPASR